MLAEDALETVRDSWLGTTFERPSKALITLVQSGKLKYVSHAVPQKEGATRLREENANLVAVEGSSLLVQTRGKVVNTPVQSLSEWVDALCGTILPALAEQPTAWAQWLCLTRTVVALEKKYGFAVAQSYATLTLSDKVGQNKLFGEYDQRIIESALAEGRMREGEPSQRRQNQQQQQQQDFGKFRGDCCKHWNQGRTCAGPPSCNLKHECSRVGCSSPKNGHRGQDCSFNKQVRGGGGGAAGPKATGRRNWNSPPGGSPPQQE
jgi:hypothetical protein